MSLRFVALVGLLSALTLVVGPAAGAGPTAVGAGQSDTSQPPGADPSNALAAVPQSDAEKKAAEKEKAAKRRAEAILYSFMPCTMDPAVCHKVLANCVDGNCTCVGEWTGVPACTREKYNRNGVSWPPSPVPSWHSRSHSH